MEAKVYTHLATFLSSRKSRSRIFSTPLPSLCRRPNHPYYPSCPTSQRNPRSPLTSACHPSISCLANDLPLNRQPKYQCFDYNRLISSLFELNEFNSTNSTGYNGVRRSRCCRVIFDAIAKLLLRIPIIRNSKGH